MNSLPFQSNELDKLYAALAEAQAEFPLIEKSRQANYGPYADMFDLIHPLRPILKKYQLTVYESCYIRDDGIMILRVKLGHSSGQFDSSEAIINSFDKDAHWGGSITFKRRYLYRGILGIVIPDDTDDNDDGHEEIEDSNEPLSNEEISLLNKLSADFQKRIKEFNKINSFNDLTRKQYNQIIKSIEKKKTRK